MSTNSSSAAEQAYMEYQKAHYNEDRGPELLVACIISIVCAALGVIVRLWAQSLIRKVFSADSILIMIAAVISIASTSCTIAAVENGLGKHELRVETNDPTPPAKTAFIFEMGYVVTLLQSVALMFTKLSILLFYRRVFTTVVTPLKWAIWILFYYCLGLGIGSTIAFICACVPPQVFWLRVYPILGYEPPEPLDAVCEPQQLHLAVPLMLDLVSEVVMLAIPAIVLWNLHLPVRKKIGVFFAFSLGTFVTAISIVRFIFAFQLQNDGDLTWDDTESFLWTSVQICFGITTACVPACAPLFRFVQSRTRTNRPSNTYGAEASKRGPNSKFGPLSKTQSAIETDSVLNFAGHTSDDLEGGWTPHSGIQSDIRGPASTPSPDIPMNHLNHLNIQVSHDVRTDYARA